MSKYCRAVADVEAHSSRMDRLAPERRYSGDESLFIADLRPCFVRVVIANELPSIHEYGLPGDEGGLF